MMLWRNSWTFSIKWQRIVLSATDWATGASLKPQKCAAALTTPVKNPENFSEEGERTPIILRRNAALRLAAEKTGTHVLDLYSVLKDKGTLCRDDGVHQTDAGYDLLAAECVKIYHQLLKQDGGLL